MSLLSRAVLRSHDLSALKIPGNHGIRTAVERRIDKHQAYTCGQGSELGIPVDYQRLVTS